jgi:DNA polymerase-1
MPPGVRTHEALEELVSTYSDFDEFVVDVETKHPYGLDPRRNDVFWISLAGPGRADAIPCGHPLGERIERDPNDDFYRIKDGKHQEHRINETSGRPKWVMVPEPFYDPPKQLWITEIIEALRPLFFSPRRKIGANVKFDIQSLAKYFGAMPPGPFADIIISGRLINENEFAYDLGTQAKRFFHFEYAKLGKKGVENYPYSEAYYYSYLDAKYTWLLWILHKELLERESQRHIFDMEMELAPAIIDMEMAGIAIDSTVLEELGKEFALEMARHQEAVNKVAGYDVNINAAAQLIDVIYGIRKHTPRNYTEKTGKPSTAAEDLEHYIKDPIVAKILDYKKLAKLQGTFINGIRERTIDGRVHPTFNQMQARTGRASCSEPNIQQIPSRSERGKRVRELFIASR